QPAVHAALHDDGSFDGIRQRLRRVSERVALVQRRLHGPWNGYGALQPGSDGTGPAEPVRRGVGRLSIRIERIAGARTGDDVDPRSRSGHPLEPDATSR